jgi:uncharacterized iron-regulated membrane protein
LHLVLALVCGLFITCLSITGALLVYAKDIQTLIQPEKWTVHKQATELPFSHIINALETKTGRQVELLMPQAEPHLAWQAKLNSGEYVSLNPYTAEVLYQYDYYSTLYGFTMAIHRWLLYQNSDNTKPLQNWVSITALVLILEVIVGFYLWVKPKNRIKRLVIKRRAKFRILMYQLHTVLGVYLAIPLILIAFSGIAFNWKSATQGVVEALTFSHVEPRPVPAPLSKSDNVTAIAIDNSYNNAMAIFPNARLFRIYFPTKPGDHIGFRLQNPGESHAYSWVWTNPLNGRVTGFYDASKANTATQVWNFKYKFHIGDFAGPVLQFVWIFIALLPAFLTLSGFYFCYKRHFR